MGYTLLPPFFSFASRCLIRHKNNDTQTYSDTLDSSSWLKKSLFRAYKKPRQSQNTVWKEDRWYWNLISTAQCVTKQSLWLTSCVLLTLTWWYIFYLDSNTYRGLWRYVKTEVDSVEWNLSVTWIIPVQLANLVLVNSLICDYTMLIYLFEDTLHKHQ